MQVRQTFSAIWGREEFMHQSRALVGGKLVQHVAGRISEGRAEAEHLLAGLGRIHHDGVGGDGGGYRLPGQWLRGCVASIAEGAPHLHRCASCWTGNYWSIGRPGWHSF